MQRTKEELAAGVVWRFVEELRERDKSGEEITFSREELEELVELLSVAAHMPEALSQNCAPELESAVRARLQKRMEQAPAPLPVGKPAATPDRTERAATWWPRAVTLIAASLTVALATVNLWHRPSPVTKPVFLPEAAAQVQPIGEREAHELIPQMVRNELQPQQERDLMWHLLICRGCFNRFVQAQRDTRPAPTASNDFLRVAER